MKSIMYIGATLMIGASIYGFVDYKKTSHSKEFHNLYDEKEVKEQAIITEKTTDVVVANEPIANQKILEEKDQIIKKAEAVQKKLPAKEDKATTKKGKKLSYKLFSRAPLDRRYLDKELNTEELRISEPAKIVLTDSLEKNRE